MRQRVEGSIERPPDVVFDFVAREHWRNHPRWDRKIIEIIPLDPGPIRAGSRARVRRKSGEGLLEVLEFEPDARWRSRSQIGPFSLDMTAVIEPTARAGTRLTLIADTHARGRFRFLLPVLGPVFSRQMRAGLGRIKEMVEGESSRA